ncbi:MAG: hypothetical protein R8M38_09910 [Mariprofundaceae bacterium]
MIDEEFEVVSLHTNEQVDNEAGSSQHLDEDVKSEPTLLMQSLSSPSIDTLTLPPLQESLPQSSASASMSTMITLLIAASALILSGIAIWMVINRQHDSRALQHQIEDVHKTVQNSIIKVEKTDPYLASLDTSLLDVRLSKLERGMGHTSPLNENKEWEQPVSRLESRISALERKIILASEKTKKIQQPQGSTSIQDITHPVIQAKAVPSQVKPKVKEQEVAKKPVKEGIGKSWVVNLFSHPSMEMAMQEKERMYKRGIETEIYQTVVNEITRYRVIISGFKTAKEAIDYANLLENEYRVKGAWAETDRRSHVSM